MTPQNITTDEKFVTIEFNTWKNKYEPMEYENRSLTNQIKDLEAQRRVTVYLAWNSNAKEWGDRRRELGTFETQIEYSTPLQQLITPTFKRELNNAVKEILRNDWGFNTSGERVFVVQEDYNKVINQLKELEKSKSERQESINKSLEKLREEYTKLQFERKAIILPRFVKWIQKKLFNV